VARKLAAGRVLINTLSHDPFAPFGGFKQSGIVGKAGSSGCRSSWNPNDHRLTEEVPDSAIASRRNASERKNDRHVPDRFQPAQLGDSLKTGKTQHLTSQSFSCVCLKVEEDAPNHVALVQAAISSGIEQGNGMRDGCQRGHEPRALTASQIGPIAGSIGPIFRRSPCRGFCLP